MDPSNTTPPQTPLNESEPPTGEPAKPQMPVAAGAPQKSKTPVMIAAIIIFVLAAAATAYYFLGPNTNKSADKTANVQNTQQPSTEQASKTQDSATTTSSFTNLANSTTVSVTHPKDWVVNANPDEDGIKQLTIKSAMGNYLHIFPNMGVGGRCDPDTYNFTLVKRVATQDPGYVFSEYTTTNPSMQRILFSIEPLSHASAAVKALKEGEGGTDVCSNLFYYPIVGSQGDIFVKIDTSAKPDYTTAVPYATLKTDTQFLAMLESLTVKNN